MKLFKKVLLSITMTLPLLLAPAAAFAASPTGATGVDASKQAVCSGIDLTQGGDGSKNTCADDGRGVDGIIKLAVNVLSWIVGVAAVIMIIVGGLKYVTSQGESSNTAGAKNTIIYALIGLVVVALAQMIVKFTLSKTTESTACPAGTSVLADGTCG